MAQNSLLRSLTVGLLVVLGAACGDSPSGPERAEDVTYAASLGIDLARMVRSTSGVYYEVRVVGQSGHVVAPNDRVTADYKGYLPDGYKFADSRLVNQRLVEMIPGFAEGMAGMLNGETRIIIIPSDLGYGQFPPDGSGIPKNSVLVFEVKLISATA